MTDVMKKLILIFLILALNSVSQAEKIDLCRRWYAHDIFQTYLRLYVDTKESLIFMDRHIPYGIRPFGYKISKVICHGDNKNLEIYSKTDFNEPFLFSFQSKSDSPTQIGTLTYYDQGGAPAHVQDWECTQEAVKKYCLEL